jgi:hypothetical protein
MATIRTSSGSPSHVCNMGGAVVIDHPAHVTNLLGRIA